MKTYGGSGSIAPSFLRLVLDAGDWSASHPGGFTPRGRALPDRWIGGWLGPKVSLNSVQLREIS
jgi:hypothetical protein